MLPLWAWYLVGIAVSFASVRVAMWREWLEIKSGDAEWTATALTLIWPMTIFCTVSIAIIYGFFEGLTWLIFPRKKDC